MNSRRLIRTPYFGTMVTGQITIVEGLGDVRFGSKADISSLLNQLVGTSQQVAWHLEAKGLRGREIDEQLKVGWLYDW